DQVAAGQAERADADREVHPAAEASVPRPGHAVGERPGPVDFGREAVAGVERDAQARALRAYPIEQAVAVDVEQNRRDRVARAVERDGAAAALRRVLVEREAGGEVVDAAVEPQRPGEREVVARPVADGRVAPRLERREAVAEVEGDAKTGAPAGSPGAV